MKYFGFEIVEIKIPEMVRKSYLVPKRHKNFHQAALVIISMLF